MFLICEECFLGASLAIAREHSAIPTSQVERPSLLAEMLEILLGAFNVMKFSVIIIMSAIFPPPREVIPQVSTYSGLSVLQVPPPVPPQSQTLEVMKPAPKTPTFTTSLNSDA